MFSQYTSTNLLLPSFLILDPADFMDIDVNFDLPIGTGLPGSQNVFCENINIVDDNIAEGPEDFLVLLSSLNGQFVTIEPTASSATVNILDDDGKKARQS